MKINIIFVCFFLFTTKYCFTQNIISEVEINNITNNNSKYFKYENLVFEGAGQAGIIYVGCVSELEKIGILDSIKNVAGTSSGAIISMFLALGYSSEEIQTIAYNFKYFKMRKGGWWIFGGFNRLQTRFGWYKNNKIISFIETAIKEKTGSTETTFLQLHNLAISSNYKYKDLYTIGINLNNQKKEIFSYKEFPNLPIKGLDVPLPSKI